MTDDNIGINQLTGNNFSVVEKEPLSLVTFDVEWSVTCNIQQSMVHNVYKVFRDKVFFGSVDVEKSPELKERFGVEVLPTIIVFKNGGEMKRFEGVQRGKWLAEYLNGITSTYPEDTDFRLMWTSLEDKTTEKKLFEKAILIVDDDPDATFCIRTILENAKFRNIDMASSCEQTEESIAKRRPDLIFLNVRMRNNMGHKVLKYIRKNSCLERIPLLVSVGQTKRAGSYEEVFEDATVLKHGKYLERPKTSQSFISLVIHMLMLRSDIIKEPATLAIDSYCPTKRE